MKPEEFPIVKEGFWFITPLFILTILSVFFLNISIVVLIFVLDLFVVFFFRNPRRTIPNAKNSVVAPADGKVVYIGKWREDEFLCKDVRKISIFMSVFNVHVNRIPVSGRITDIFYKKGKFFSANFDKASLHNEKNALLLETEDHNKVLFVQIAGLIARRIVCWVQRGDGVRKGQRFGLICFGSRLDIFLPLESAIQVKVAQRVKAGETILGYLN